MGVSNPPHKHLHHCTKTSGWETNRLHVPLPFPSGPYLTRGGGLRNRRDLRARKGYRGGGQWAGALDGSIQTGSSPWTLPQGAVLLLPASPPASRSLLERWTEAVGKRPGQTSPDCWCDLSLCFLCNWIDHHIVHPKWFLLLSRLSCFSDLLQNATMKRYADTG